MNNVPAVHNTVDTTVHQAGTDTGTVSYRQLIWRRFRKNRMGIAAGIILIFFYMVTIGAGFFAPYHYNEINVEVKHLPPQSLHYTWHDGLHVYGLQRTKNPLTLESTYTSDPQVIYPVTFFFQDREGGYHLVGSDGPFYLLGTDRMGRDVLSRIIYGGRVSMTVGLVGVVLSLFLGSILGTLSGYWGGWVDQLIQRIIEILAAFPPIPLWMALGAALPPGWSSVETYFGIIIILSIISWGGTGTGSER